MMKPLQDILQQLRYQDKDAPQELRLHCAGLPHFKSNFTRDSIIAALLMEDWQMLKDQLLYSAHLQGKKADPRTGEEPGKMHHEFPDVAFGELTTRYNACDTTSLFLLGVARYHAKNPDEQLPVALADPIDQAVGYVTRHIQDGTFIETPSLCGGTTFANKVTYWKDTILPGRDQGTPAWPVVYPLAHVCAYAALRELSQVLPAYQCLAKSAEQLRTSLGTLWDESRGQLYLAKDSLGAIGAYASDSLHALWYLEDKDIPESWVRQIEAHAKKLETPIGFRVMAESDSQEIASTYHFHTVWPFEQAIIHAGAVKFGLPGVAAIAERMYQRLSLDGPHEVYRYKDTAWSPYHCDTQLWSVATYEYFEREKSEFS